MVANFYNNIVVCPRANAALNVGVAPLNKMFNLGINPLLGTDNVMLNSPDMLRELEFSLKIMSIFYKNYLDPLKLLKSATTNISNFRINNYIKKSYIELNNNAELFICKFISKNPYLNIINRCKTKNILYVINKVDIKDYIINI